MERCFKIIGKKALALGMLCVTVSTVTSLQKIVFLSSVNDQIGGLGEILSRVADSPR